MSQHIDPPARDLFTHELVGFLRALKIQTQPRNYSSTSKPITAAMIRQAVTHGHLVAKKVGNYNVFTPAAIQQWVNGGCQYASKRVNEEAE